MGASIVCENLLFVSACFRAYTHVKGNVIDLVHTFVSVVVNYLTLHPLFAASFSHCQF